MIANDDGLNEKTNNDDDIQTSFFGVSEEDHEDDTDGGIMAI